MPLQATIIGALLFALGPIFYLQGAAGHQSLTSFIPSVFGILIVAFGLMARTPTRTKTGMHGVATLALLGVLGALSGAPKWPLLLTGRASQLEPGKVLSGSSTLLMFILCGVLVAMCVNSFRSARRRAR